MRLIDLSQPLFDGCPNCPEHPPVKSEILFDHDQVGWRLELLTVVNHTASHVDAPLHKLKGAPSLDDIPLEKWVGPAHIADLRNSRADQRYRPADFAPVLPKDLADKIVLIASGWGYKRARTDEWLNHAPMVGADGAKWLVDQGIRGVGIDYYSIGDATVHEILLSKGIWIVEELHFPAETFALPQPVQFWSLPVNFKGHTGAFCRPVIVVSPDAIRP
jgi:kynurenine formamidase